MKIKELTQKQLSSVRCPTCGVAAGERCVTSARGLRFAPHPDRKLLASEAVEKKNSRDKLTSISGGHRQLISGSMLF
jgi:hypothetical protein